tara:strand:+ start:637 stop:1776 length:1140 start_codon:yes stop_codon:yes gene_type:complete
MKRSQLERYIKQAIKEAMHIDSQGNLHSDDDKIKRAGEDKDQLIYHKGEEIKQRAFFDDKINGRRVEGFWIGPQSSWGDHGRQFYVWDPELARGGHVLGSFTINSNRGNLDSHVSVDQNPTKITHGKAKKIIEDIKKEVLRRISDGTLEETMSGVPTHADEFEDSSSQDDIGVNSGGDMDTHSGISQLESYIKEAINGYLNGSPWSHGIAVGHKINKYNDPELIKSRYDDAAKDGFKGRPKGRLSTPRGYSLNEGCGCGCGGCETMELEEDMSIDEVLLLEIDENITEAKYKGKTVKLNKPMRGDSKKFKVYVNSGKKNADGSIKVKKVNFGHGGTSAKRPTMRIRKSNPKRRKAFRARHRCDNPGPNTMARYWSCKKW